MRKKSYSFFIFVLMCMIFCACGQNRTNQSDEAGKQTIGDEGLSGEGSEQEVTYEQISLEEAKQLMADEEGYMILDVRTLEEYADGHIPGAICVPNETIDDVMPEELPDKEQLILVYCRSGNRSKQASKKLAELGYSNVKEFGGIMDWDGEIER